MFQIDIIKNKISGFFGSSPVKTGEKEIKKASDPTSSPEDSGQDDMEILASEITGLLDDGTISPETDKIKKWAVSKGLSEDSAEDFANQVISAYFSDEDEDDMPKDEDLLEDEDYENDEEENEDEDEDDEVTKAALEQLSSIDENQKVIMKGLESLTEALQEIIPRVEKLEKSGEDVAVLKAKLGEIKETPVNAKTPVTHVQTTTTTKADDEVSVPIIKSWVKTQFQKGNPYGLGLNEVTALDSGYVSPNIKELYKSERGNK